MMKVCSLLFTSPFVIPYSMFCSSKQILKFDFFKKAKMLQNIQYPTPGIKNRFVNNNQPYDH